MTTRTFRPYDPEELWLLPPSPCDWLPEDHLAYFLSDLVEALNLQPILATYGGVTRGTAPYHPQLLVKVLLYAYAVGIPASRQIARKLEEDVAFRVLAANQRPDFRTLSDFRRQHLTALAELFVQVLKLCQRAGLVKLGHIALDGTKVKANASKHKAMSYGRMVTEEARLQAEVEQLLTQAEAADTRDDATYGPEWRGDELPAELARREQRLETIRAAKAVLEQEAQAEAALKETHTTTRPRRGRPPQSPSPRPHPKGQRNFTDPESRIMPASDAKGSFVQGYNCQVAVDATAQIIVAAAVTDETNDKQQAQPMLTHIMANTGVVPRVVSMDTGYFSEANVTALTALGCTPLIPPDRQLHSQVVPAAPRGRPLARLSVADRMRRTLRTKRGRRCYARRKAIVEPVFGQIKQGRGYRQFLLRGMRQVRGEWALICTTHNVRKLWTALRRRHPGERLQALGRRRTAERKTQG
jgi:transposase